MDAPIPADKAVEMQKDMNLGRVGKLGMIHLNGNVLCAIDLETTGDIPGFHDIIQVCILPLNAAMNPMKEIIPFYCDIKPKREEHCSKENTRVNRAKLCNAMINGLEASRAADLFDNWMQKLKLAPDHRISPLASNWPHDRDFIIDWLGYETFHQFFDARFRDTQVAALFLNDRDDFNSEQIKFGRITLKNLCNYLKIEHEFAHDALQDCLATTEVYKRLIKLI